MSASPSPATIAPRVERTSPLLIAAMVVLALTILALGYEVWLLRSGPVSAVRDQLLHDSRVQAEFGNGFKLEGALGWSLNGLTTVYAYGRGPLARGFAFFELYQADSGRWVVSQGELRDVTEDHVLSFTPIAGIAPIAQLHGKGHVYLVALGTSASNEVSDLAKFLEQECGLHAEILPFVEPAQAAYHAKRKQWIAEMLIDQMAEKFPRLAADPDARILGVIDEDIYPRSLGWDATFSFRYANKYTVVQTAALDPAFSGLPPSPVIRTERLRKTAMKCLGFLYFGFHEGIHEKVRPESLMSFEATLGRIDAAYGHYLLSDVATQATSIDTRGEPCLSFSNLNVAGVPLLEPVHVCAAQYRIDRGSAFYIDLSRGEFRTERNDIYGSGPQRFLLQRLYASHYYDSKVRAFGKSTWFNLDDTVWSTDPRSIQTINIRGVEFRRITPGAGFDPQARYAAPGNSGEFDYALLTWEGRWKIEGENREVWHYRGCEPDSAIPCYFIDETNPSGDRVAVERDGRGHIVRAVQTAGKDLEDFGEHVWRFYYNGDAVRRVEDGDGSDIRYLYDSDGFLTDVQADNRSLHYEYDAAHRMNRVVEDGHVLDVIYDTEGRVVALDSDHHPMYRIRYSGETIEVNSQEKSYLIKMREGFFELTTQP